MSYRVLSAEIAHETNTFSRRLTDELAFRNRYYVVGEEALAQRADANTEVGEQR